MCSCVKTRVSPLHDWLVEVVGGVDVAYVPFTKTLINRFRNMTVIVPLKRVLLFISQGALFSVLFGAFYTVPLFSFA